MEDKEKKNILQEQENNNVPCIDEKEKVPNKVQIDKDTKDKNIKKEHKNISKKKKVVIYSVIVTIIIIAASILIAQIKFKAISNIISSF